MKEIFSSFFSSANIIVRATICGTIELPLQGAWFVFVRYPGRCPGLWRNWAFSPHYLRFDTPSSYRLPLIYRDKYDAYFKL